MRGREAGIGITEDGLPAYIADRRRFRRTTFDPPIQGRIGEILVDVVGMSVANANVLHDTTLPAHDHFRLAVDWYEPIEMEARVVRTDSVDGRFSSVLAFDVPPASLVRSLALRTSSQQIERLESLVRASKLVNSAIEPDALVEAILTVARSELGVHSAAIFFLDHRRREIWTKRLEGGESRVVRFSMGRGLAGQVAASGMPLMLEDAYSDSRFDPAVDLVTGYSENAILCVPVCDRDESVVGVLEFLHEHRRSFGSADLDFLEGISEHVAIAMRNAAFVQERIERNRMRAELEVGREIQTRLLPLPPAEWSTVDIAVNSVPCFEVGGDCYDFIDLPDGELGLAIGDVSGKGVAAALIMSSAQAALRVAAPTEPDLGQLISRLDALLLRTTPPQRFVTFFFACFSPTGGVLRYVNAGHNPPLLCTAGRVRRLESSGPPLGILHGATFREESAPFEEGSTLVLYTDGFPEATNMEGEEFGMKRWQEIVCSMATEPAGRISRDLTGAITRFENGARPMDDKTLVVLRHRSTAA